MSSLAAPIRPTAAYQWFEQRLPELVSRCQAFIHRFPKAEREEAQAEVLAQSFRYVVGAEQRGKLHRLTPFTLVSFFGRSYRAGCLMTGSHPKDVLSEAARIKNGHKIFSLQTPDPAALRKQQQVQVSLADTLADSKADRPLENVRRNLDYDDILDREAANRKVRRVFRFFCETAGQGPQVELARELGVSPPRVCQLKAQLADMLAAHDYEPPATRRKKQSFSRRRKSSAGHRRREIPLNVATNDVSRLPPEFTRKGRIDEIYGIYLPTTAERMEIFSIHLRLKNRKPDDFDLTGLANATEAYTGADIREVVLTGLKFAFHANKQLSTEHLLAAVPEIRPLSKTDPERVAAMTEWLDRHTKSASSRQSASTSCSTPAVKRLRRVAV